VQLKNRSDHPVYGPFQVEVTGFTLSPEDSESQTLPVIMNAANGKSGVGAVFDYRGALGTWEALPPGGRTEPVRWQLRLPGLKWLEQ
jgi:hypothetical protein